MTEITRIGSTAPKLRLYLPHQPDGLAQLAERPDARDLIARNTNHWRKIITLLAKVASPQPDAWRTYRDTTLFGDTALCFSAELEATPPSWHWIGGQDNLARFGIDTRQAQPLTPGSAIAIDSHACLLLTPYPDYRQLPNVMVAEVRRALDAQGFYRTGVGA